MRVTHSFRRLSLHYPGYVPLLFLEIRKMTKHELWISRIPNWDESLFFHSTVLFVMETRPFVHFFTLSYQTVEKGVYRFTIVSHRFIKNRRTTPREASHHVSYTQKVIDQHEKGLRIESERPLSSSDHSLVWERRYLNEEGEFVYHYGFQLIEPFALCINRS